MQLSWVTGFTSFPANLSDREAVKALAKSAEETLEGVEILVNNAGITRDGLFVRMSDDDWDAVLNVNLTSVFQLTRDLTHPMMRRRHGRIINITSVVGVTGNPGSGELLRFQSGADRVFKVACAGNCFTQRYRELRRARISSNRP